MSLNQAQTEAVAHNEGPCMVLAGPGSGKTLTIAKRIEYLIQKYKVRPEEILVITFTKYAANEMRGRFRSVSGRKTAAVTFGTFHGIFYGILKWAYGLNRFHLLSEQEKYELIKKAAEKTEWERECDPDEEKEVWADLAAEIGNVKNNCQDIRYYSSLNHPEERFRELYQTYEQMKQKRNKIDFEDMLTGCRDLFLKRPDILKKWQNKYRYILVDEFQDINQAQYDVIRMLAAPENNLFVVGDDDQSIYGFRGAKPGIMMKFQEDYPDAVRINLNINYRSTGNIVRASLRVIAHNRFRYKKELLSSGEPGDNVHVQEVRDPVEESQYVCEQIQAIRENGGSYEHTAVLFRTNLDARILSETLTEYHIPFVMKEQIENIYEHFIGLDMRSYLNLALGHMERKDLLRIANRPNRYIARDSMESSSVSYEALRNYYCDKSWMMDRIDQLEWDMKMIRDKTPYAAIQYIRKSMGYDTFLKEYAEYRGISLEELYAVAEEIQQSSRRFPSTKEWFRHMEDYRRVLEQQKKEHTQRQGVALLTMHGAKGLEFDQVFLIHSNEKCIPYKKAKTEEEIEEERRLFYVGMTRARKKLVISYVKEKNGKDMSPSRFVDELFHI